MSAIYHSRLRRFLPAFFLCALFLLNMAVFGQDDAAAGGDAAGGAPVAEQRTVMDTILHGGPLIIMIWIAILGTSIIMVTLIVQNILTLKPAKLAPPALVQSLQQTIAAGNYQEAWE